MTVRPVFVIVLHCDGIPSCDTTFPGLIGWNTSDTRASARYAGWRYGERRNAIAVRGHSGKRTFDWCPTCDDPREETP